MPAKLGDAFLALAQPARPWRSTRQGAQNRQGLWSGASSC